MSTVDFAPAAADAPQPSPDAERFTSESVMAVVAGVRGSAYKAIQTAVNMFLADERVTDESRERAKNVWFDLVTRGDGGLTRGELRSTVHALSAVEAALRGNIIDADEQLRLAELAAVTV